MRIIIIYCMAESDDTLATLKQGQTGRIESIDASDPQVQRLMVLGLVEGTDVEFASAAPGGDPMEFRFFGSGDFVAQRASQPLQGHATQQR